MPREHSLFALENNPATFTYESIETDFLDWKSMFMSKWDLDDRTVVSDCSLALEKSQLLSLQYQRLVPGDVCARDFWCRYLFRRALLLRNEPSIEATQSPTLPSAQADDEPSDACGGSSGTSLKEPSGHVANAESSDGSEFSSSQTTAPTSGDDFVVLPSGGAAPNELHSSDDFPASNAGVSSSSSAAPSAASSAHSSAQVAQQPSSSEAAGWDEWE
jgi:hypothetical protein